MCGAVRARVFSWASLSVSQVRCSGVSQRACAGPLGSTNRHATPMTTAGTASRMNIHCQPCSPIQPSVCSSSAEIGDPIRLETGIATMNIATIRPRYSAGNQ